MKLRTGSLHMQYENGFLRYISVGDTEVLRMIYFAVRDKDWGTVPGTLLNEKIAHSEQGFSIAYEMQFEQDSIRMHWTVTIEGRPDNTIVFDIKGKALSTFQKNRTGFCVLHPIKECRGKKVTITHTDASAEESSFPHHISPHQPFKNIKQMQWKPGANCTVEVAFAGDIFETEDQRNWGDNSYKTYCTPQERPQPATLYEGEEVHQQILVKVECSKPEDKQNDDITITVLEERIPMPFIGVASASERNEHHRKALELLSAIGFAHYRADILLSNTSWQQRLTEAIEECKLINAPLEIALFIREGNAAQLHEFVQVIGSTDSIKHIILLQEHVDFIDNALLQNAYEIIHTALPNITVGAGSDLYFTELNRSALDKGLADFVSYPINPQVHAIDSTTMIENCEAQAYSVETALHRFGKPVYVSPVTLKQYYNPARADNNASVPLPADERQSTQFCAAWTLGSLKYLIEAGATSVTYFETVGKRGLMADDEQLTPYPVLDKVFRQVLSNHATYARKSTSSHPLVCDALVIGNGTEEYLMIANYSNHDIAVALKGVAPNTPIPVSALEIQTIPLLAASCES